MDIYGNTHDLSQKKLWLLDMDGTIYEENRLFDGVLEFLARIEQNGGRYVFITNNSSRSLSAYMDKVRAMGIPASEDNFFTSVQATELMLKEKHPGALVYVQGTHSMVSELREANIRVTEEVEDDIDVILVGFDTELNFEKLTKTCILLGRDLPFYATNPDLVCPTSFGFVPDCGSMCYGIFNATGKKPVYIGKPEPAMIDIVRGKFGATREETIVVGDRHYTDILAANNAGVTALLVLSGETKLEDLGPDTAKPDLIYNAVSEVFG